MSLEEHRERVFENLGAAFDRVKEINEFLVRFEAGLKATQPKKPGAVTLILNNCGTGCAGCPHPKWGKWSSRKSPKVGGDDLWVMSYIKTPMQSLKQSGEFAEYYEDTKALVQESLDLIKEREKLLATIGTVGRNFHYLVKRAEEKNRS